MDYFKKHVGLLISLLLLLGCRGAQTETARKQETSHLRSLVTLHNFAASKLGHRPATEAEFKKFIANNAKPMLDTLKISSPDELFVSERDGQPFVVIYGKPPAGAGADLIAYEQTGVAGKRFAGFSLGNIEEVDEQRFAELTRAMSKPGK